MMESSHAVSDGDRLSKLNDRALGHVLSFLPAEEAARAASLSSRWRHVFGAVHTVSFVEPESPIPDYDKLRQRSYSPGWGPPADPNPPPPFYSIVSAGIIARQRRCGAAPLRALRVAAGGYSGHRGDSLTLDQWVSYAVQQGADDGEGLDLDLRLWCRRRVCGRLYALRRGQQQHKKDGVGGRRPGPTVAVHDTMVEKERRPVPTTIHAAESECNDDMSAAAVVTSESSGDEDDDDDRRRRRRWVVPEYTATRVIFSCAHLRSLSLSSCRLAPPPPDTVTLPSLVTLLLSHVSDPGSDVERLVACCPRLADLTLEACSKVTALSIVAGARLRRLAIRCCHSLTTVAVDDSSELQAFEYRGAVPDRSFLTLHENGGGGSTSTTTRIMYCKVDICGEEATSEKELVRLRQFLRLFVNAEHLHLESARLGSGLDRAVPMKLPSFSSLLHLEMRGCLPDDDDADAAGAIAAMSTVLEHAPNLVTLSLAFHPQEHDSGGRPEHIRVPEQELLDAHHLSYNPGYNPDLALPTTASAMTMIPCLRNKVREINLVHYQGGAAQRAMAKFLLSNATVLHKLWCVFAEGPMWTQVQLMREMEGWLTNKSAQAHFV